MADKKRRNTPNTGNKRNNGRRKKKGRLKGLIAAGTGNRNHQLRKEYP